MKLELKHLAPYLPYKLKGNYEVSEVVPSAKFELRNKELRTDNIDFFLKYAKPILRPLSDLTKEIEVNGKKFVPAEILFSVENNELQDFKDFGKIPEYWKDAIKIKPKWYDYYQVEFLFEWHFDVFGLIEKGLAVDINTLQNP